MYRNRINKELMFLWIKNERNLVKSNKFMDTFSVILYYAMYGIMPVSTSTSKEKKKSKHVKIEVRFK